MWYKAVQKALLVMVSHLVKVGDKALDCALTLLGKRILYTEGYGIVDKLTILCSCDPTVKRARHTLHRSILTHKADIYAILVGIVKIFEIQLCLSEKAR